MKLSLAISTLALTVTPAFAFNSYLDSVSGASSLAPPPPPMTFAPKPAAPVSSGSYLDKLAGPETSTPISPPQAVQFSGFSQPAPAAAAVAPQTQVEFSGFGDAVAPADGNYLNSLKVSSTEGGGSAPQGYLQTLRVDSAPVGAGLSGYLDNLPASDAAPVAVTTTTEATGESESPVLAAIAKMNQSMNRNQKATIGILEDINECMTTLADRTEASKTAVQEKTELTNALQSRNPEPAWTGNTWNP